MDQLYIYNNQVVTLGQLEALWIINCIKEPFWEWVNRQEKVKSKQK